MGLLQDWVEYHLALGVDRLVLYDIDGSAREALQPYIASGVVQLFAQFPLDVAPGLARTTASDAPYCSPLVALNHCLFSQGPFTDVVIEIRSPDEFWHVVDNPGPGALRSFVSSLGNINDIGLLDVAQLRFSSLEATTAAHEARQSDPASSFRNCMINGHT